MHSPRNRLFVGHMDYKYLRWQMIDTPGIFDHKLDECNTIEMQTVTALAHLHVFVLFFVDLSPHYEYSIETLCSLFKNFAPIFANKPIVVVASKSDMRELSELSEEESTHLRSITSDRNVPLIAVSNITESASRTPG
eukprot:17573_1